MNIDSNDAEAHEGLSNVYMKKGEYKKAMEHINLAIKCNPKYINAYFNRGVNYWTIGNATEDISKAIANKNTGINDIRNAIKLDSNNDSYIFTLGDMYRSVGDFKNAEKQYEKVIICNPNKIEARYNLGIMYVENGKYKDAVIQFKKTIELDPARYEGAYINLGELYYKILKDNQKAIKYYREALNVMENIGDKKERVIEIRNKISEIEKEIIKNIY